MARSIGEWYDNASGQRTGVPGYDPENDEAVDRTPDRWLDDLHAPRTPENRRAPRAVTPLSRQSVSAALRSSGTTRRTPAGMAVTAKSLARKDTDAATPGQLGRAARALQADQPWLSIKAMTRQLRQQLGWPSLASARVEEALGRRPGNTLAEDARAIMAEFPGIGPKKLAARLRRQGWAKATPDTIQTALRQRPTPKVTPQRVAAAAAKSAAAKSQDAMGRRIRAIDASAPGWTVSALTEAVRRKGWPNATEDDVRMALLGSDAPRATDPAPIQRDASAKSVAATMPKAGKRAQQRGPVSRAQATTPRTGRARVKPNEATRARAAKRGAWLQVDVRAFYAAHPQARPEQVMEHLRRWGWPAITAEEVRQVLFKLSLLPPSLPAAAEEQTLSASSRAAPESGPYRTLDLQVRPNTCYACGRVISRLGVCGCY